MWEIVHQYAWRCNNIKQRNVKHAITIRVVTNWRNSHFWDWKKLENAFWILTFDCSSFFITWYCYILLIKHHSLTLSMLMVIYSNQTMIYLRFTILFSSMNILIIQRQTSQILLFITLSYEYLIATCRKSCADDLFVNQSNISLPSMVLR